MKGATEAGGWGCSGVGGQGEGAVGQEGRKLQVRGETSELLPPLWAYQPASHGCPQIREVAGASLTSHTPLLFVS